MWQWQRQCWHSRSGITVSCACLPGRPISLPRRKCWLDKLHGRISCACATTFRCVVAVADTTCCLSLITTSAVDKPDTQDSCWVFYSVLLLPRTTACDRHAQPQYADCRHSDIMRLAVRRTQSAELSVDFHSQCKQCVVLVGYVILYNGIYYTGLH